MNGEPSVDLPFDEAIQELTGFEVIAAQRHYGTELEHMGGVRSLCAAVWAYRNRVERTDWATVERMSLRDLHGFFAEPDPDPDSDQGKALRPGGARLGGSPRSA